MGLRKALARWLYPKAFEDSEELFRLRSNISELWWWGLSDQITIAAGWLNCITYRRMQSREGFLKDVDNKIFPPFPFNDRIGEFRSWIHANKNNAELLQSTIARYREYISKRSL